MLDKLEAKNIYQNVTCSLVGGGNKLTGIKDNTYDGVVISGGFAQAHMPVDSIREVARVLKPGKFLKSLIFSEVSNCWMFASGGVFINNMTEYYLTSVDTLHDLEPLMKKMQDEGVWYWVSREAEPAMLGGKTGVFHTFIKRTN